MTLYLRADQSTLEQALIDAGLAQTVEDEDGNTVFQEDTSRVVYIGTILKGGLARTHGDDITDSDGNLLDGMDEPVSGTHAIVATNDQATIDALSDVTIAEPNTPYRTFA